MGHNSKENQDMWSSLRPVLAHMRKKKITQFRTVGLSAFFLSAFIALTAHTGADVRVTRLKQMGGGDAENAHQTLVVKCEQSGKVKPPHPHSQPDCESVAQATINELIQEKSVYEAARNTGAAGGLLSLLGVAAAQMKLAGLRRQHRSLFR